MPVPAVVSAEQFDLVQRRLAVNQRSAPAQHHPSLPAARAGQLRGLPAELQRDHRSASDTRYRYYRCRGKQAKVNSGRQRCCPARIIAAGQLDELVWAELCAVLQHPEQVA